MGSQRRQGTLRLGICLLSPAGAQIGLTQPDHKGRERGPLAHRRKLPNSLLEQPQCLGEATGQSVCVSYTSGERRDPVAQVAGLAHGKTPFEYRDGRREITLAEG